MSKLPSDHCVIDKYNYIMIWGSDRNLYASFINLYLCAIDGKSADECFNEMYYNKSK